MRSPESLRLSVSLAAILAGALLLAGCTTHRASTSSSSTKGVATVAADAKALGPGGTEAPKDEDIVLTLAAGRSWKSRFLSTSEVILTLKGADGKEQTKTNVSGLELIATQTVESVSGNTARISVHETGVRILKDGKFIDAPYRQFGPPNPVAFTIDTVTGKADFTEMEKAYGNWMERMKGGTAAEILGRAGWLESFMVQLKNIYGKPFNRFTGMKIYKGTPKPAKKEIVVPFMAPGMGYLPVPVEATAWYEGIEEGKDKGERFLKAAGKYSGRRELSADELARQLSEFGAAAPKEFQSSVDTGGQYTSLVEVSTGREVRASGQLRHSTSAAFGGATITLKIAGKTMLEAAD